MTTIEVRSDRRAAQGLNLSQLLASGMSSALYIIRPLPAGLYELTGARLPFPLRFKDDAAPLNHAHFCGRGQSGKAIVLSRSGAVLFCEAGGAMSC